MSIKLIVGLRNPGASYEYTRHNAGSWFVEAFGRHEHLIFKLDKKLRGELATFEHNATPCKVLLPATFMNLSGESVRSVCQFYRILPTEVLVAHDELDLPVGQIKLKTGGGTGGHNGLQNIGNQLGTKDFHRLRIGIGHPGHKELVLDYVLGKPSQHDKHLITDAIDRAILVMPPILNGDIVMAMNILHRGV